MPDGRIRVFVEGQVDRAVLAQLREAALLPETLDLPEPTTQLTGIDQVLRSTASAIDARLKAIAMVDYDEHPSMESLAARMKQRLRDELGRLGSKVASDLRTAANLVEVRIDATIQAIIVPVGCTVTLEGYGASSRAMDDFVLTLALEADAYGTLREQDRDLVEHEHLVRKTKEVLALMQANGIPVRDSKRLCLLLRGLANFHSSQATFAERLMRRTHALDPTRLQARFGSLIDALRAAEALLRPADTNQ